MGNEEGLQSGKELKTDRLTMSTATSAAAMHSHEMRKTKADFSAAPALLTTRQV